MRIAFLIFLFCFFCCGFGFSLTYSSLREITEALSRDSLDGRASLSKGNKEAREWLVNWLKSHDFQPAGESGGYEQPFNYGTNILAVVNGKEGVNPVVLVSAHYDHLGECRQYSKAGSGACNGASDNAVGVAVALTAVSDYAQKLEIPVVVAIWDSEEDSFYGSRYFLKKPTFSLVDLRLILNFDIVGLNLFLGMENRHFVIGSESGGPALGEDLRSLAGDHFELGFLSYAFGHNRSDITPFVEDNQHIPFVFFSDGDGGPYHSSADEIGLVNFEKATWLAEMAGNLIQIAATRKVGYSYSAPTLYQGQAIPGHQDVETLLKVVRDLKKNKVANRLDESDLASLGRLEQQLSPYSGEAAVPISMEGAMAIGQAAGILMGLSRKAFFDQ